MVRQSHMYQVPSFFHNGMQFTIVKTVYNYREKDDFIKEMKRQGLSYRIKKHETGWSKGSYKLYKEVR